GLDRGGPRGRRLAGHRDTGGPRRGRAVGAGDPERDALRPHPHRRLALAGRARRDRGLSRRGRRARRDPRAARAMGDPPSYLLERAWVDGAVHDDVLVEIEDGRFTSVTPDTGSRRFVGVATPT